MNCVYQKIFLKELFHVSPTLIQIGLFSNPKKMECMWLKKEKRKKKEDAQFLSKLSITP